MLTLARMRNLSLLFASVVLVSQPLSGQEKGVLGYWKEPGGSVIHVDRCGTDVCATLVSISPAAPSRVDGKNPNHELQGQSLCGLQLGEGFHLVSAIRAEGGTLYDPKSGKTYHGVMTSNGNALDLRGYIGLSIFGRTERWTRIAAVNACTR